MELLEQWHAANTPRPSLLPLGKLGSSGGVPDIYSTGRGVAYGTARDDVPRGSNSTHREVQEQQQHYQAPYISRSGGLFPVLSGRGNSLQHRHGDGMMLSGLMSSLGVGHRTLFG